MPALDPIPVVEALRDPGKREEAGKIEAPVTDATGASSEGYKSTGWDLSFWKPILLGTASLLRIRQLKDHSRPCARDSRNQAENTA